MPLSRGVNRRNDLMSIACDKGYVEVIGAQLIDIALSLERTGYLKMVGSPVRVGRQAYCHRFDITEAGRKAYAAMLERTKKAEKKSGH